MNTLQHPDRLCRRLKLDVLPLFQKIQKAFVVSEVQHLGKQLDLLGNEFQVKELAAYGSHLFKLIDTLNVEELQTSLIQYADQIEGLSKALESRHD